jgi:hypothetical protein
VENRSRIGGRKIESKYINRKERRIACFSKPLKKYFRGFAFLCKTGWLISLFSVDAE